MPLIKVRITTDKSAVIRQLIRGNPRCVKMKEALYWKEKEDKKVQCFLCPHNCIIGENKAGICRVRKNVDGKLYSLTYNEFTSVAMDPIEKKPLYHFYPATEILSFGTVGCNLHCQFCQNWEISQQSPENASTRTITPEEAVRLAKTSDSVGIAYTYNEPLINYEWLLETAQLAQKYNLKNVLVTNGYLNETPLENLLPYVDAANIDVKSFRNDFYRKICGGTLDAVLRTVEIIVKRKKHVEVTNLIVPTLNDSEEEMEDLVDWISALDVEIPLHFSRYFPCYKMQIEATPLATLEKARKIALKKLKYVYMGNVWEVEYNRTYCPNCQAVLIERRGYNTKIMDLKGDTCGKCGKKISIVT